MEESKFTWEELLSNKRLSELKKGNDLSDKGKTIEKSKTIEFDSDYKRILTSPPPIARVS